MLALAALVLWSPTSAGARPLHIDHVIVGTRDLDAAIAEIARRTGVRPVPGGVHPGRGTRNALMSLGPGTYLELYAPDPAQPVASKDAANLGRLRHPTPIGWAVSAPDEKRLRSAARSTGLGLTPSEPGSRRLPDGSLLRWSTFGFRHFDGDEFPFFIHWAEARTHPSRTSPTGCRLLGLNIATPAAPGLNRVIARLRGPVRVTRRGTARMVLTLRCPKGSVSFG